MEELINRKMEGGIDRYVVLNVSKNIAGWRWMGGGIYGGAGMG